PARQAVRRLQLPVLEQRASRRRPGGPGDQHPGARRQQPAAAGDIPDHAVSHRPVPPDGAHAGHGFLGTGHQLRPATDVVTSWRASRRKPDVAISSRKIATSGLRLDARQNYGTIPLRPRSPPVPRLLPTTSGTTSLVKPKWFKVALEVNAT